MPIRRRAFCAALLLTGAMAVADGVRIMPLADPACNEIRDTATEFLTALADGHPDAARALFAGPPEQAEVLDAYIDWVTSGQRLHATIMAKFNDSAALIGIDPTVFVRKRVNELPKMLVALGRGGDDAFIATAGWLDLGIGVRRMDGRYRITEFSSYSWSAGTFARFFRDTAAALRQSNGEIEATRPPTLEAAIHLVSERMNPAFMALASPKTDFARDRKAEDAGVSPVHIADAPRLAALIGRPFGSAEVQELIAALPDPPRLSLSAESFFIGSRSAGLDLIVEARGTLRTVILHAAGADGYQQFNGQLPAGLTFGDRRRDVERKLGRPSMSSGSSSFRYWAEYPAAGISVHYVSTDTRDPSNSIHHVALVAPTTPASPAATRPATATDLTLRLVANADNTAATDVLADPQDAAGRRTMRVHRGVLLDGSAIEEVVPTAGTKGSNNAGIDFVLTPDGARRFEEITAANIDRQIAVIFEGRILIAPVVRAKLGRRVHIDIPPDTNFPDYTRTLCGRIHAAVTALP